MKKLLKEYALNSDMSYYEMIVESIINGNIKQGHAQFSAMPKSNRISFLKASTAGYWESGLTNQRLMELFDLI